MERPLGSHRVAQVSAEVPRSTESSEVRGAFRLLAGGDLAAVSLSATLLVCAVFRLHPCRQASIFGRFRPGPVGLHAKRPPHHRSSEGRILASSRPAKTTNSSSAFAPRRISFGRIDRKSVV